MQLAEGTQKPPTRYSPYFDAAIALIVVFVACIFLALRYGLNHGYTLEKALEMAGMCTVRVLGGPFTLWFTVFTARDFSGARLGIDAVLFASMVTAFSLLPWFVYLRVPSRDSLVAALMIWLFIGYFFGIGVLT